jgi:23S rRNA (cytidine1920-2'-O)/16S rRNA (cytidine1409-2'-O)-methyltransferase
VGGNYRFSAGFAEIQPDGGLKMTSCDLCDDASTLSLCVANFLTVASRPRLRSTNTEYWLVGRSPKSHRVRLARREKLDGALQRFDIAVDGIVAFDAGASTGGFTDCLLQRGAHLVVAVDVGHGQLHERIRSDQRVEVHERVNLRTVNVATTFSGRRFELIVGDLSFISLRSVATNLCELCADDANLVLLVKPQFEAGREEVSRGRGVIRDPEVWRRTLTDVASTFRLLNATMIDVMPSPITGADGNVEFLMWVQRSEKASESGVHLAIDVAVEAAIAVTLPRDASPEVSPV